MPHSKEGTEAEKQHSREASMTHGAYAFQARGVAALDQPGRSRLIELEEAVQTREGALDLLRERAANAVMLTELLTSYVSQQVKGGLPLADIPVLRALPAFYNTALRSLHDLLIYSPDDSTPANAELERIQKVIEEHDKQIIE